MRQEGFWTPSRIAELRRLWSLNTPTKVIAKRLGVSGNAIIGKADRLHLPEHANAPKPWPRHRVDKLRQLFAAGLDSDSLARELAVSRSAVMAKKVRLGLRDRERNQERAR